MSSPTTKSLHWTRRVRSVISSVADIVGDWFYFFYIYNLDDERINPDIYIPILLACCVVSSIVGLISIITVGCGRKQFCCGGKTSTNTTSIISCCCFTLTPSKLWHLIEILLEDIPQVVVAAYISYLLSSFSPRAVFNLTTSGMNFFLDFLDIFEPSDDNDENNDDGGQQQQQQVDLEDNSSRNYSAQAY